MKLKVCKKSILALSCAVQIILLSLSAISPDIHSRICHGEHGVSFQESYCEDHRSHDGDLPSPQHSPTHEDHTCPVSLFATGIVSLLVIDIVESRFSTTPEIIRVEQKIICEAFLLRAGQPRAPPLALIYS